MKAFEEEEYEQTSWEAQLVPDRLLLLNNLKFFQRLLEKRTITVNIIRIN